MYRAHVVYINTHLCVFVLGGKEPDTLVRDHDDGVLLAECLVLACSNTTQTTHISRQAQGASHFNDNSVQSLTINRLFLVFVKQCLAILLLKNKRKVHEMQSTAFKQQESAQTYHLLDIL